MVRFGIFFGRVDLKKNSFRCFLRVLSNMKVFKQFFAGSVRCDQSTITVRDKQSTVTYQKQLDFTVL